VLHFDVAVISNRIVRELTTSWMCDLHPSMLCRGRLVEALRPQRLLRGASSRNGEAKIVHATHVRRNPYERHRIFLNGEANTLHATAVRRNPYERQAVGTITFRRLARYFLVVFIWQCVLVCRCIIVNVECEDILRFVSQRFFVLLVFRAAAFSNPF